ncbi:uncharacterized protein LOC118181014 [Stegodyphus dumicola]|uniref:uncharacterized protein LOC118181014 n=1 Tax=Stegodyphus dumicola TaxID=202533 RepID=UPI0015AF38C0|nr:uncharacterized protein LOC118181014 [Stegodyphus dumicola]XP_035205988.1 uncharacterized protein LOC118181014 [Stegodyphus dumicola]
MGKTSTYWVLLLSTCILLQSMVLPAASAPFSDITTELEERQTPLVPSQFSLAATRFIVMLPFLPLMMAIPGVTAIIMPLFMAMQDRLKTIIPTFPNLIGGGNRPSSISNIGGSVSNIGNSISNIANSISNSGGSNSVASESETSSASPTFFRFRRSLFRLPTKAINEGFKEVFEFLHKTDDVLNQLTSSQPDCRRQAVCRLHHSFDPSIGSFLGNVLQVFKIESKIEKLDVSEFTRSVIKDVLRAAHTGLFQRDCTSVYSRCSIVVPNRKP